MDQANEKLKEHLATYELLPGELNPFVTINPGDKEPIVSVITLKPIPGEKEGRAEFSRLLDKKPLLELVQELIK